MPVWKRWLLSALVMMLVIPPLIFGAWAWITLHYVYATGERAGYIQKISRKGWLFKTWEGDLAMVNLPGTMPEIFQFSVREPEIAGEIEKKIGQRVSLTYEQHKGIPSNAFGDTDYFIVHVSSVS